MTLKITWLLLSPDYWLNERREGNAEWNGEDNLTFDGNNYGDYLTAKGDAKDDYLTIEGDAKNNGEGGDCEDIIDARCSYHQCWNTLVNKNKSNIGRKGLMDWILTLG